MSHFCFIELHLTFVHLFVPIYLQNQTQSLGLSTFYFVFIYYYLINDGEIFLLEAVGREIIGDFEVERQTV